MIFYSEQINEIGAALAAAQGELENAAKKSENPFFKSKYADLAEVLNVVRPALSRHGISVTQHPSYEGNVVTVETLIIHSSGQWIKSSLASPVGKADAQGIGSATTYCRRYALAAAVGIAQEDDDGNAASRRTGAGKTEAPPDDEYTAAINAAADIMTLQAAWNAIPVGVRAKYTAAKDEAKVRIAGKAA